MRVKKDILLIGLALIMLALIWTQSPKEMSFLRIQNDDKSANSIQNQSELVDHHHHHPSHPSHMNQRHTRHVDPDKTNHGLHPVFTGATMYVYWPPPLSGMTRPGRKFAVDIHLAKQIKQMSKHFFVLNEQTMDKFVFVMAASSNHFEESMDGVASIQHHFPGKKLFYYDLGLHHQQVLRMKSWKWVEYRKFDFTIYPKYFDENLRMVGWKPIIIQEVMAEYGAVFWMDASVRLLTNDFSSAYAQLRDNGGMMLFKQTKHSNFAATHRGTYDYIPTNRTRQMRTPMCIATAILAYNTKAMFYNVLWWFFLCALDRSCQAPMAKTMCDFDLDNKWATFADCHKWDQSTLNILLSNYYGYRHHKYLADDQLVAVERWPTHRYTIVMNDDRD